MKKNNTDQEAIDVAKNQLIEIQKSGNMARFNEYAGRFHEILQRLKHSLMPHQLNLKTIDISPWTTISELNIIVENIHLGDIEIKLKDKTRQQL